MEKNLYFSRRSSVVNNQSKTKQKSLYLCFVLKRITNQNMLFPIEALKRYSQNYVKRIQRMERISSINSEICVIAAWNKIKSFSRQNKVKNRIIKDVLILGGRIQKLLLKQSFFRMKQKVYQNNNLIIQKYDQLRKVTLARTIKNLNTKNKKMAWSILQKNMINKRQLKRLGIINSVFKHALFRNLNIGWLKIKNYKKADNKNHKNIQQLQCQLQDLKVQVQNKNDNVNRLQEQIRQLRQSFLLKPGDQSSLFFNNSFGSRSFSNLQRSRNKFHSSFEKDSNDGSVKENSFGSILGTSYVSVKSRGSNAGSKVQQCPCSNCGYRQKYQKYKTTNQTLKKQLQIIKTELQFTKDMNQHMQNEIKANLSCQDKERDKKLQKIRTQLRQCQKDRQVLRQKVLKYQKYVSKLKQQFKTKIQEIYRRVKKTT